MIKLKINDNGIKRIFMSLGNLYFNNKNSFTLKSTFKFIDPSTSGFVNVIMHHLIFPELCVLLKMFQNDSDSPGILHNLF